MLDFLWDISDEFDRARLSLGDKWRGFEENREDSGGCLRNFGKRYYSEIIGWFF